MLLIFAGHILYTLKRKEGVKDLEVYYFSFGDLLGTYVNLSCELHKCHWKSCRGVCDECCNACAQFFSATGIFLRRVKGEATNCASSIS